jgi:hypothetical protein
VAQLGANAFGEVLEPGRVPDCCLGLLLADDPQHPGVLVVAPAALLHPAVPQPDGTLLYELVTGHPDRAPSELVFLADLTVELRAWPLDTWAKVGVDPQATARAVIGGWRRGDLPGRRLGGLTAQKALALERPAMTYVRARLEGPAAAPARRRLPAVAAAVQRPPGRRPVPVAADTRRLRKCLRRTPTVRTPTVWTPTLRTATAFRKQQRTATASAASGSAATQTPAQCVRLPGRLRQTAADPQPPFRHHGSAAQVAVACLRWSRGHASTAGGYRLPGRGLPDSGCPDADTGRGLPDSGSTLASALRTPATAVGCADTAAAAALDSRQQNRGPPQPCPTGTDRKVRPRTGQHPA